MAVLSQLRFCSVLCKPAVYSTVKKLYIEKSFSGQSKKNHKVHNHKEHYKIGI